MSAKLFLSIVLGGLCLLAPMSYTPQGSWSEFAILLVITFSIISTTWNIYTHRTLVQGSQARRGQLPFDSLWSPALWGAWVSIFGVALSLIPFPLEIISLFAPKVAHHWEEFEQAAKPIMYLAKLEPSSHYTLSLSPAQSWHWLSFQFAWIALVYLSGLTRGFRRLLLVALVCIGPLLTITAAIHALGQTGLLYFYIQSSDRALLSGFITALINPNHAASLLMLSAFLALGLMQEASGSAKSTKLFILCRLSLIISSLGVVFTSSRAAVIIYIMMLTLWFVRKRLSWVCFRQVLLFIVLGVSVFLPALMMALAHLQWWQAQEIVKAQSWLDSWLIIYNYFPWGIGREAFGEVFTQYQSLKTVNWISHPENIVICNLSEAGIFGVLSICFYVFSWWKWWRLPTISQHPLAMSLGLGVTAIALHQSFDFGSESLGVLIPLGCAWGLMWSYQPNLRVKHINLKKEAGYKTKKRPSAWSKSFKQSLLLSILIGSGVLGGWIQSSPLRKLTKTYDQSSEIKLLIEQTDSHPLSAHLSVRIANSAELSFEERLLWVKRSKRLAPRWFSPLLMEARLHQQLGFEQMASLNYRRLLLEFPELRDRIFKDVFSSKSALSAPTWLPTKDMYSFFRQYKEVDAQRAQTFLTELSSEQVISDLNLRALYIRYVVSSCEATKQKALGALINEYEKLISLKAKIDRKPEATYHKSQKYKNECFLIHDLNVAKLSREICQYPLGSTLDKESLPSSEKELYWPLKEAACFKEQQNELKVRARKSFFSLRKLLKNR